VRSTLQEDRRMMEISPQHGVVEIGQVIGGEEKPLERAIEVNNPGKLSELVGRVADGTAEDAELAVAAAAAAAEEWGRTSIETRVSLFAEIADALEERAEWLATVGARENGSVRHIVRSELRGCAPAFRAVADYLERKLAPEEYPGGAEGELVRVERRPFGVVVCIVPWNAPLILTSNKLASALAAGNAVVLKPSPFAPIGSTVIAQLAARILPPGVVNIVNGGIDVGSTLVEHPAVRKVSFTGGGQTARVIMQQAAGNLKGVHFELGGNDPAIVLDDADFDVTIDRLVQSAFRRAGQVCFAAKRVYVPRSRADEFRQKLVARVDQIAVGEPLDERATMGAVNNRGQFERVHELISGARSQGRDVRELGIRLEPDNWENGYYLQPTVVLDAQQSDDIVREEQFGPVLPVVTYEHEDDAVRMANDSELGLSSSVWSASTGRALELASRLEAGATIVNHHLFSIAGNHHIPFGGWKQSGMGWEGSPHGIDEYLQFRSFDVQALPGESRST